MRSAAGVDPATGRTAVIWDYSKLKDGCFGKCTEKLQERTDLYVKAKW